MHSNTVEWYVNWLKEARPDWTDEQRLEVATGFADRQQVPVTKSTTVGDEDEEVMPDGETVGNRRAKERSEKRLADFIGGLYKQAGE